MTPESFIGFGLAFLASSWGASAVLCGLVLAAARLLARTGARAERRAAALAICLGPLLGAVVLIALAGQSFLGSALGAPDHCPAHDHHLHLCLFHGEPWASLAWTVMATAGAGAALAVGLAARLGRAWAGRCALGRLARVARPAGRVGALPILIAPARLPFCFTAGISRPRVFVSTAAWERLDARGRAAMLAHEEAHARHGDLAWSAGLGALALLGAPFLAARVLARWQGAAERLCDGEAARRVSPSAVAEALLALVRPAGEPAPSFGAGPFAAFGGGDVVERVERVLEERPDGQATARRLGRAGALLAGACALAAFTLADPLHHLLETLLGAF